MSAPGHSTTIIDEAVSRSSVGELATWIVVGFTRKGRTDELIEINGMDEFVAKLGELASYSNLYDSLDVAFRLGLRRALVARQLGLTPVKATANLLDQAGSTAPGDVSLVVTAVDYGDYANGLNVEVTASGGNFTVLVSHDDDGALQDSGLLADRAAAVAWSAESDYIRLTLGASAEDPRAQGPTSLAGGDDDHTNATTTEFDAALALATREYGFAHVSAPGQTTDAVRAALQDHGEEFHRIAIEDPIDSALVADLTADAQNGRDRTSARAGGLFAPWPKFAGVAAGTTRTVPPSAAIAGLLARNDANGESINQAAAGRWGKVDGATGLSQAAWSEVDRETLNDAGVNALRIIDGRVTVYGFRTLVDPDVRPQWRDLSGARTAAIIASQADTIVGRYVFAQNDGHGHMKAVMGADLIDLCRGFADPPHRALFASELPDGTIDPGYSVDVGPTVNTPQTEADGKLRAKISLKTSPTAEVIELVISKQAVA